jgi:hypothetical protein
MRPRLIASASKEEINDALLYVISTLGKYLSVFSLLICWIPYLSLPICIYSMYLVRGRTGTWRTLSILALIVSITFSSIFLLMWIITSWGGP